MKTLKAGALNRRVTLLQPVYDDDLAVTNYVDAGTAWGRYAPSSGSEGIDAAVRDGEAGGRWEFRETALTRQIKSDWRIEHGERIYHVEAVDQHEIKGHLKVDTVTRDEGV